MTQHAVDGVDQPAKEGGEQVAYGASDHYNANYFAWQNAHIDVKVKVKVKRFASHIKPTHTVLDFGCAGGGLLSALNCTRRIGVELNDVARASAVRDHGIEAYKWVADVPDAVADVIISNHALEHIEAPMEALRQLRPKIKPGGKLVLCLPIDDWRAQKQWDSSDINHHLYTWTPLLLGNTLSDAGYDPGQMKIVRHTLMRGFDKFAKLPEPLFDAVCTLYSYVRHRQDLVAVATPRQD